MKSGQNYTTYFDRLNSLTAARQRLGQVTNLTTNFVLCFWLREYCLWIVHFRTGNQARAHVHFFVLAKEEQQMAKFARCPFAFAKTTANCYNSFCHLWLIGESASTAFDCNRPYAQWCHKAWCPQRMLDLVGKLNKQYM